MKLNIRLISILILLFGIGGFLLLYYREGTLPINKINPSSKVFVINKGESLITIVKNLQGAGLIRNDIVFYLILKQLGLDKNIQAGDFRLSTDMNAYQVAQNLTHGTLDVWVTLIEGTRKEEMAHIISQSLDIPESEFINSAQEGYLFPDTYLIPRDATAGSIIKIMTDNFDLKFDQQLKQKAQAKGLSPKEVVILASLVEKEARNDEDRPIIAGILLNRMKNDWPLQVDATIQYALGYQPDKKTWWKKDLTQDDLNINSSYNTYLVKGLPPGPICNPGLASIKAVINADTSTPYMYYISDKTGKMHYAKTLEEQNANIQKYLQ